MDCVLEGFYCSCQVYNDDIIIIIGRFFDEHLYHSQQVLDHLKYYLFHFLQQEVSFPSHIVGVLPDSSKTLKIREWAYFNISARS